MSVRVELRQGHVFQLSSVTVPRAFGSHHPISVRTLDSPGPARTLFPLTKRHWIKVTQEQRRATEQLRSHSFTASLQVQDCIMFSWDLLLHGIGCISRASNSPKPIDFSLSFAHPAGPTRQINFVSPS
ncbi:hypothetical protein K435DRAFT_315563 [Dendrothele bispora CBS 962.96]|uniref:Uncharacterized protein n=1 Tax=Dendrothele bispora (strain CBS 962.96) TaxID=1314807 RepID=A0A4S8LH49_DENBC|nr:hypothetical protein K435DRAFT_315563 [Dendrothele bispora CBS 962.96]